MRLAGRIIYARMDHIVNVDEYEYADCFAGKTAWTTGYTGPPGNNYVQYRAAIPGVLEYNEEKTWI